MAKKLKTFIIQYSQVGHTNKVEERIVRAPTLSSLKPKLWMIQHAYIIEVELLNAHYYENKKITPTTFRATHCNALEKRNG